MPSFSRGDQVKMIRHHEKPLTLPLEMYLRHKRNKTTLKIEKHKDWTVKISMSDHNVVLNRVEADKLYRFLESWIEYYDSH